MNRQIVQLFALVTLLFAALVLWTTRWTVLEAESLEDNAANRRPLLEEQKIPRGLILARDGERLAVNDAIGRGETRRFVRDYPTGPLFSHPVGYSFVDRGRSGLEQERNEALSGEESEFASIVDEFLDRGGREGENVRTTLDAKAQRTAIQRLGGRRGSVVAIDPRSGRVRVMVSIPDFDPNEVRDRYRQLNRDPASPLLNRATQARYQPGSTMKVVSAVAAIDSGRFNADSVVSGRNNKPISGVPLQNFGGQDFGPVSLTEALTNSVNTVWAEVAVKTGGRTMFRYMDRFGFNQEPPIDYPTRQLTPSGVFDRGELIADPDEVDIGRMAIGQERLQVTPLQMAMVSAAVANGGKLMSPRLTERIVGKDGRVRERIEPDEFDQVMKPSTARTVTGMMGKVVEEGSGTAAALRGVKVAGKTGTAEVDGGAANQAWFIGLAPLDNPRMAIAVTIERTQGTGGEEAAPIAKAVLESLLGEEA
jgi:peptidoglycan glycosyltransferase